MKCNFTNFSFYLFLLLFAFSANNVMAQKHAEKAPDSVKPTGPVIDNQGEKVLALWDLEFSYDASLESEQALSLIHI